MNGIRLSLRARLLLAMALVVASLGAATWWITAATRTNLIQQIDERLSSVSGQDRDDAFDRGPGPAGGGGGPPPNDGRGPERVSEVYEGVVVDDAVETVFAPNAGGEEQALPEIDVADALEAARSGRNFTVDAVGDGDLRYRVEGHVSGTGRVYVTALPLDHVDSTMDRLVAVELAAIALIVAVLAAVTWWVIRLGIRPIKQMTTAAEQIAQGDLSRRVPEASPASEAGQLGVALNHMLQQLEVAFGENEASQRRLRRFVADASHELRTPVTTIRGYTELYRMGGLRGDGELDEAMRRTEAESIRMARLVDELVELAKFDQGRPLERRPLDLAVLVADAARDAAAVDPARPISANVVGSVIVEGDEDRLRQVLANIVGNALAHTPADAPVELAASVVDHLARITVTDHGPGMAAEVAAQVTERFFRGDPARTRHRGGSGLGMSIADAVATAHGGRIEVASELGRGTTVTVTLPAIVT